MNNLDIGRAERHTVAWCVTLWSYFIRFDASAKLTGTRALTRLRTRRGGRVLRFPIAERPVLFRHIDQIDEHILAPQLELAVQAIRQRLVEPLLHFQAASAVQRNLEEDAVVAALY